VNGGDFDDVVADLGVVVANLAHIELIRETQAGNTETGHEHQNIRTRRESWWL
jgi:hypothetical protein